jgi:hypothetical protein
MKCLKIRIFLSRSTNIFTSESKLYSLSKFCPRFPLSDLGWIIKFRKIKFSVSQKVLGAHIVFLLLLDCGFH